MTTNQGPSPEDVDKAIEMLKAEKMTNDEVVALCYLCTLGHPEARKPAVWRVDCRLSVPVHAVYSCADHYGPIVGAAATLGGKPLMTRLA